MYSGCFRYHYSLFVQLVGLNFAVPRNFIFTNAAIKKQYALAMAIRKLVYNVVFLLGVFLAKKCNCFGVTPFNSGRKHQLFNGHLHVRQSSYWSTALRSDKFNRDIDEKSRQRASEKGGGSVAAGAILGGLVGGPFGALFGAAVGGNIGSKNALDRARKEEMEKKGVSQEMLDAAEEVGYALEQSMEGMEATKESLRSQQSLARRIEYDMNDYYDKAKSAMVDGREEDARKFLLERSKNQDSLKDALKRCAEEMKRIGVMESNVSALQKRALEVEAILQRAVGAKARQNSSDFADRQYPLSDTDFSLSREDPLLKKFNDLGID
jgi:phage shock protein A